MYPAVLQFVGFFSLHAHLQVSSFHLNLTFIE